MDERIYNISLSKIYDKPHNRRARHAVEYLKSFVSKHTKSDHINLSESVNKLLWSRSISKPPKHIKVKTIKKEDVTYVLLPDEVLKENKEEKKEKKEAKKDEKKEKSEKSKSEQKYKKQELKTKDAPKKDEK